MTARTTYPLMRHYALALVALGAGCAPDPPPPAPLPVDAAVEPDSAGGAPAPTGDEIDAGADILKDAL